MAVHSLKDFETAAYGWADCTPPGMPDEEILARLFKLNQVRNA